MIGKRAQAFWALAALLASLVSPLGAIPAQANSLQPSIGGEETVRLEPGPPYRQVDSGLWPSLADLPAWESYYASSPSEAASPAGPGPQPERTGQTIALPFDFSLSPVAPPSASPGELDSQSESACQIGASPLGFSISPLAAPPPAPPARPSLRDIPLSLLTVDVTGPDVASLGSPPGSGEVYTAVIRNNSTDVAYGLYLTATHPSFFIHDGGDRLISRTGTITLNVVASTSVITWTPVPTFNLAAGEVITLNFRLRAACDAESGQRMEIGVRYNADPPPASPVELNTGGLNITTGRGNLVIKKEPPLQNLGTPDFGKPITWTITVQNTGLGRLYNAVITDNGGINLAPPTLSPPTTTIPVLEVNEIQTYTAVGVVEACNFTNVAQGSWSCGNLVGDATITNPVSSTTSVLFSPQIPNINVQVSGLITFPYCDPITRTVTITVNSTGGPAANFRLDSTFESDGFLEVVASSVSSDWQYIASTGLFSYTGGSPAGTIPGAGAGAPVTLTFQVRPQSAPVCAAGGGGIVFTPLYNEVCSGDPFTSNPVELDYQYAQDEAPTLDISKSGPDVVTSGEVFTYYVTVSGQNPQNINGSINITDLLPTQFVLQSYTPSTGTVTPAGAQTVTWSFDPPDAPAVFTETLALQVQVVVTEDMCGASLIVNNDVQAVAIPTCPGCPSLNPTDQVQTAIQNNEGIFPGHSTSGSFEACGDGFTIANSYLITGSYVVTWTGAVFTEALGTPIGEGALPGPTYLTYQTGSLSVTVNGLDYTSIVTPVTTTGQLVIDLTPLQAAGAPTQNLTLLITYTIEIPEAALNGAVEQTFHDWSQLFLPNFSEIEGCAVNNAFNQVLILTIGRGDLSVGLSPQILDKCSTNPVIITVNDNAPGRLTDHIVVTFTSSIAEIASARNFTYTGSLAGITPINVVTQPNIGGGRGIITFTLPITADIDGDGEIRFEVDVNCTDEADWDAGINLQSRCDFSHGHGTSLSHVYRAPNLILFATPIQYTVREKEVIWKFFVTNNGNLTATNVVVTNTISGLSVITYTPDSPVGVSVSGTLPITDPNPVVFTIAELGPNQQRAVTVTAQVIACTPLHVTINAWHGCFSTTCSQPQAEVSFNTPDPYLLTNNGETADLPMCDEGEVIFTTKNASADVTLYQLNITETLINLIPVPGAPMTVTIVDDAGAQIASTTAFTPEQVFSGTNQVLLMWKAISATTEVMTWFNALLPLYVVRIFVPVNTSCVPPNAPQSFASASAQGPCGKHLGYTENAITLNTLAPDMGVLKDGRVAGGAFGETIYAAPGETVVWRIRVYNRPTTRSYVAHNVVLSDTWPSNFAFITTSLAYTPTVIAAQRTITWDIGEMAPQVAPLEFFITGTVAVTDDACSAATMNTTRLTFGCDDGCASSIVPIDTAQLETQPNLTVQLHPDPLHICEGDIPITIRNYGARAYSNTLTVTLPSGYVYSYTVSSGLTLTQIITDPLQPQFLWDTIPGRTGSNPYQFDLVLRIKNSGVSGACPVADGQPVTATLRYDNHPVCTDPGPWVAITNTLLVVLTPNLVKSPHTQTVDVGQWITWTITLSNSNGVAGSTMVTDVVDSNFANVTATIGSDGSPPTVVGNMVTWTPNNVPVGGVWTATVRAQLLSSGGNRNVVTAIGDCASGCQTTVVSDTAYATLLQSFEKNPAVQTGTIGSLVVFTFTTSLSDWDALYERLTLTDTLPTGLGYVASTLVYLYDVDGTPVGPIISTTPTITPGWLASGNVVWRLGDLPGTVQINGVITAVIQNIAGNQDGVRRTNNLRMTYTDDNQPYVYTDTADVDIQEPLLHIGKSYVTPQGCNATLLQDNFNSAVGSPPPGWTAVTGTWSIGTGANAGLALLSGGTATSATLIRTGFSAADFSFSAMLFSTDGSSSRGLVFRYIDAGNYYRLRLRDNDGGTDVRLEQLTGGVLNVLTTTTVLAPDVNTWYHTEVRAEQSRLQVYVNGQRLFDFTNATLLSPGSVGLYTNICGNNQCRFDDVLVTRFGNMACTVGANDLVTYTLTISNQARLPGYDLTITDAIPTGMSLVTYTMQSDDPASAVTAGPAPIPGATGSLIWNITQLTATSPFSPLNHTALTLTVVLTVSDAITANATLPNQASLSYDNWEENGDSLGDQYGINIERTSSGGSHSTAVLTTLSLGDLVWYDYNNNGVYESGLGESGIPGVMMQLYLAGQTPGVDTPLLTTTTNINGRYVFTGLVAGGYIIHIPASQFSVGRPLEYLTSTIPTQVNPNTDTNEDVDENGIPNAYGVSSGIVTLTVGTEPLGEDVTGIDTNTLDSNSNLTVDFGFFVPVPVSLGNQVWYDVNNDGALNAGEVGVPDVAVELYLDTDGDGAFTPGVDQFRSTTTTTAGGYYTFTNLLPTRYPTETYLVVITSTNFTGAGVLAGYQNSDGSVDGNSDLNSRDHGVVSGTLGAGGLVASTPVSLTVGGEPTNDGDTDANSNLTIDFGFYLTPDMVLVKDVTPGAAVRNMPFTYTIHITNTGQVTFTTVVLTDTLPPDFYYIVGSGSPADPNVIAEPLLVWSNLGSLDPGDGLTVTFAVTATPGITGTYINTATVAGHYPGGVLTDTNDAPIAITDPAVVVDKQVASWDSDPVAPNYITFTITITNVGPSVIGELPLLDQYDITYLSFVTATPYPEEDADDGLLTWYDLTGPAPNGFNRNLAPGESFHVTTVFSVVRDIPTTVNTAVVTDALDVYINSANESRDDAVINNLPTAVELLYFRVGEVTEREVRLEWATAVEVDNFGFRLYRALGADRSQASPVAFIPAQALGGGATYVYTDTVPSDGVWWYWLADVDTSGEETFHGPIDARVGAAGRSNQIYLPLIMK